MRFESRLLTAKGKPRKRVHSQDRMVLANFLRNGSSRHSLYGHFASMILNHCVANGIAFILRYHPGGGFTIVKDPGDDKHDMMGDRG